MIPPSPTDKYIGEPQYPSPWATKRPKEGLRDNDEAIIVSLAPDVCRSPTVPVPYPIVDFCGHDENYTPSVRFTGQKAMVLRSNTTHVHGDEPGVGKGIKSGTVGDISEPIGHAPEVRAEGSPVIRHLDRFWMNRRNTQGEAIFVRNTRTFDPPKDDDPVPGTLQMASQAAEALPKPQPAPAPRPPGQVIRPDVPQWRRPPPTTPKAPSIGTGLGRLGRFGARAGGLLLGLLWPDPLGDGTLPNWYHDLRSSDPFRRRTAEEAQRLYERDFKLRSELEEWYREETENRPTPAPLPNSENVEVDKEKEWPCLVGPHNVISKVCPGEAHHIVPDMALRYGNRVEGMQGQNRIPNAPSFGQGMTVCLTGGMHGGLHGSLNSTLGSIGATNNPAGTAPMLDILEASTDSIDSIKGLSQECKERAKAAARAQVMPLAAQPGRTTLSLPTPAARTVLQRGFY